MTRRVLNVAQPIVENNGTMSQQLQEWSTLLTRLLPFNGDGSPEGIVEAKQYSRYVQDDGSSGSVCWIKLVDDIGGDKTTGWVLE